MLGLVSDLEQFAGRGKLGEGPGRVICWRPRERFDLCIGDFCDCGCHCNCAGVEDDGDGDGGEGGVGGRGGVG